MLPLANTCVQLMVVCDGKNKVMISFDFCPLHMLKLTRVHFFLKKIVINIAIYFRFLLNIVWTISRKEQTVL